MLYEIIASSDDGYGGEGQHGSVAVRHTEAAAWERAATLAAEESERLKSGGHGMVYVRDNPDYFGGRRVQVLCEGRIAVDFRVFPIEDHD